MSAAAYSAAADFVFSATLAISLKPITITARSFFHRVAGPRKLVDDQAEPVDHKEI